MAKVQLYKNKYNYPDYGAIASYGGEKNCTPVGMGLRTGTIRFEAQANDFMACNYLRIKREGSTIYAWITDIEYLNDLLYNVHYEVDAYRTYKGDITLGHQFVERSMEKTDKPDELLASQTDVPIIRTHKFTGHSSSRVLIVQLRSVEGALGEPASTPVQPTPYSFFAVPYNVNNWQRTQPIITLIHELSQSAESNVVTMYSIPYMNTSSLPELPMKLKLGSDEKTIDGFKAIPNHDDTYKHLVVKTAIPIDDIYSDSLMRVDHTVQLVIPEAGIMDIPDPLIKKGALKLRQDVDLFSGASNFMLEDLNGNVYSQSVRGSSVSSIPILSDSMDTYLSQNQSALTTSLIGDVATTAVGAGMSMSGGGALAGVPVAISGINSMFSKGAQAQDMKNMNNSSNPPSFLGTALGGAFNNTYWVVVTKKGQSNQAVVHNYFGYPIKRVQKFELPNKGYIKTQGCSVSSNGNVPKWAIEEINSMFNNGVLFY